MATQAKSLDSACLCNEKDRSSGPDDTNPLDTVFETSITNRQLNLEIWVGYSSGDRHFIDKVELPGNAEMALHGLRTWWEGQVSVWKRVVQCFVFSLRPCILIGSLPFASKNEIASQYFPHETQFTSLERSELLTRGFHNPASLVDDSRYFDQDPSFYAVLSDGTSTELRHVLYVGWEVDKRYLAYPFLGGGLGLATGSAVSVAIRMQDVATGAQVGGSLCGVVAGVFCYVGWRCS